MQYIHHQLTVELPIEGIVSIDHIHLSQGINRHGRLKLRATVEEERALELVEQAQALWLQLGVQQGSRQEPLFWGKSDIMKVIRKDGLLTLEMVFYGGTKEWDVCPKGQSFSRLGQSYEEVLKQVVAQYAKAELRDEVSGGAGIPRFLLQYEETDWAFPLQRVSQN